MLDKNKSIILKKFNFYQKIKYLDPINLIHLWSGWIGSYMQKKDYTNPTQPVNTSSTQVLIITQHTKWPLGPSMNKNKTQHTKVWRDFLPALIIFHLHPALKVKNQKHPYV